MVAGMSSYLAAAGVEVHTRISQTSLILSSDRGHLTDGGFDPERMIRSLDDAVVQAVKDGYEGLFATGDMAWEFGSEKNFPKLLEYEWRLEKLFHSQPMLRGICQYHIDALPREIPHRGLLMHPEVFVNDTLSRINPQYVPVESLADLNSMSLELNRTANPGSVKAEIA